MATACLLLFVLQLFAQGPNNSGTYYRDANGKKGRALKTALYGIINSGVNNISYDGLLTHYKQTDCRPDGKVWDIYSNTTNFSFSDNGSNYKKEGDIYNREHTVPQSWFSKGSPMKSDIVHVLPTDGYVNNRRSSYPYGETDRPTYSSNNGFSKLGPCSVEGYSGTVFEPNDEYKGDIARIYFYMATRYENKVSSWNDGNATAVFAGNPYPVFKGWFLKMLLRWAKEDPVSQKEIDRNNAVYKCQRNRNPYVDYPGLEQYVWGDKIEESFSYDNYDGSNPNPDPTPDPDPDPTPDPNPDPTPDPDPDPTPTDGVVFVKAKSMDDIVAGSYYIMVFEGNDAARSCALASVSSASSYFLGADVTIADNGSVTTSVNQNGKPHQLLLGGSADAYTLYDTMDKNYLTLTKNDNKLHVTTAANVKNAQWTISMNGGVTHIYNNVFTNREIRFNSGSPRFACYEGSQQAVYLYRKAVETGIGSTVAVEGMKVNVYSVTGVAVRRNVDVSTAFEGLGKGVYILNGKKFVVD